MKKKIILLILIASLFLIGCGKEKEENSENDCPENAIIENNKCKIKAEEYEAKQGLICEEEYRLEEDRCILEEFKEAVKKYVCEEGLTLNDDTCSGTITKELATIYSCKTGSLDGKKCNTKTLIGDAKASCSIYPDPVILENGNCYLGLPLLPGGCENGDMQRGEWCYNMSEPKVPEYTCKRGTLEGSKCYSIKVTSATSAKGCEEGYKLSNKKCVKTVVDEKATLELACETGFELVDSKCIKIVEDVPATMGYICEDKAFVLENNKCVRYEYQKKN